MTIGVEAAGWPSIPWATLQVGMVQSISRRKFSINPGIVMVDEAHHARAATWEKVLQRWPNAMLIGLTATPQRLDGKGLDEFFNVMISGPTIPELVDMDFLAPTRTLTLPIALKLAGVRKTKHGEYRQSDLAERVTGSVVAKAADAYLRYAKGRKAIFFGIHIDHSKQVCAALRARGVRAEHVDGTDTMGRRDRVMLEFKAGDVDVVGNCDLISEGYDAPACDAILMGASTNSVTRYLQQAGRAMRYRPGKTALVLDLAGISHDLGLPDDVREWSLESGELDKRGKPNGDCAAESVHAVPDGVPLAPMSDVRLSSAGGRRRGSRDGAGGGDGQTAEGPAGSQGVLLARARGCSKGRRSEAGVGANGRRAGIQAGLGRSRAESVGNGTVTAQTGRRCLERSVDIGERPNKAVRCVENAAAGPKPPFAAARKSNFVLPRLRCGH